jgi:hypothetical protein
LIRVSIRLDGLALNLEVATRKTPVFLMKAKLTPSTFYQLKGKIIFYEYGRTVSFMRFYRSEENLRGVVY